MGRSHRCLASWSVRTHGDRDPHLTNYVSNLRKSLPPALIWIMVEHTGTGDLIPELPDVVHAEGSSQTVGSGQALILHNEHSSGVLGRDIAADLSGMAASPTDAPLNRALVVGINYAMSVQKEAKERAEEQMDTQAAECARLRDEAKQASIEAAGLRATLKGLRESSDLRAVLNTLGGVILGLSPYAADKSGLWATLGVIAVGLILVFVAWLKKSSGSES